MHYSIRRGGVTGATGPRRPVSWCRRDRRRCSRTGLQPGCGLRFPGIRRRTDSDRARFRTPAGWCCWPAHLAGCGPAPRCRLVLDSRNQYGRGPGSKVTSRVVWPSQPCVRRRGHRSVASRTSRASTTWLLRLRARTWRCKACRSRRRTGCCATVAAASLRRGARPMRRRLAVVPTA